jgi:hypothetical protein
MRNDEMSLYNNDAIKHEKQKVLEAIKKLFMFQNKLVKDELVSEWGAELISRRYTSEQVVRALKSLEGESLGHIDFGMIVKALEHTPESTGKELCLVCGDENEQGEYIASGYVTGLNIPLDAMPTETRLACTCEKGQRLAKKFQIRQWDGKAEMPIKNGIIKIFDKQSDKYPKD